MQKTLTKEQLAAKLNGIEYRDSIPKGLLEAAKENNLVIIHGGSDDIVSFFGAISDEEYASDGGIVRLSRKGIPKSDCDDENCPYFNAWLRRAIQTSEVIELQVFWCGQCKNEAMDAEEYAAFGKPTWCYRILSSLDLSCQKPDVEAAEHSSEAVEHWRRHDWVRIKKKRTKTVTS